LEPHKAAIIGNAQFYHECKDSAMHKEIPQMSSSGYVRDSDEESEEGPEEIGDREAIAGGGNLTEAGLEEFLQDRAQTHKVLHGKHAVECAKVVQVFSPFSDTWETEVTSSSITHGDMEKLAGWKEAMKHGDATVASEGVEAQGDWIGGVDFLADRLGRCHGAADGGVEPLNSSETFLPSGAVNTSHLQTDQRQAFDIITTHARNNIDGGMGEQLLMLLLGEGGTGKSVVISTVTSFFEVQGKGDMLAKGAYTV
jgi:hypothetical protein